MLFCYKHKMRNVEIITALIVTILSQLISSLSSSAPKVIVIGAGPAGIAATTKLLENNYTDLLLLEAENRIGGRVHSVKFGDAFIDLGAEWCHGQDGNIVYEMLKDLNVLQHTKYEETIYHSNQHDLGKELSNELLAILKAIYSADGHRHEIEGESVGSHCIKQFNSTMHKQFQNSTKKLELAKGVLELLHHLVLSSEGAFSWFDPSAESDYRDCGGDLTITWSGLGYKTALEYLMKKYPDPGQQLPVDDKILLKKEVSEIYWNENATNSAVTVYCSDNSSYVADHVIFTPSVGVLKHQHKELFIPELPQEKVDAIRTIGIGAVIKIAMFFERKWWKQDRFPVIYFTWDEKDKEMARKEFPEGPVKDGRSWVTDLFSLGPVEYNPNVIICWCTGDLVPEIELLPNETIMKGLDYVLNKFLGNEYNVTQPTSILRTHWYSNPHFRGTYSYQTIEARKNKVSPEVELSKPLLNAKGRPILQFAGEATHPYYYSTVHGAIETGHREANRIIDLYK